MIPTENTTGSAVDVQHELAGWWIRARRFAQWKFPPTGWYRPCGGIEICGVGLYQLKPRSLDYHGDMEHYEAAKWLLYSEIIAVRRLLTPTMKWAAAGWQTAGRGCGINGRSY